MVKENSLVSENVDGKYIQNSIRSAQEIHLQPVIGSKLFKRLCEGVQEQNLTEIETELIDTYIQPLLINAVLSDLVIQLSYKFRNMGSVQTTDTNLVVPSLKDLQYIKEDYNMKKDFYVNRLNDFLKANRSAFLSYYPGCGCGEMKANPSAYKLNITL